MLFAFPLAFAQELDACRIQQQVKFSLAACVWQLNIHIELPPAQGVEVRHWPIKPRQLQHWTTPVT